MGDGDKITIKYHDGTVNVVDASTKKSVKKALQTAVNKFEPQVFRGVSVHVASDFSNLPTKGSAMNNYLREHESDFWATGGVSTDNSFEREIFIQESHFSKKFKPINLFTKFSFSADEEIEQYTMHELGHIFDFYGGNPELKEKHDQLIRKYYDKQFETFEALPEEEKFMIEYMKDNGFSDKKDFKKAIEKDLSQLELTSSITNNYGYLLGEFYNRGLDIIPNSEDVENADASRMEIFAQLFSYAMGTDDGNKEKFIKMFPNAYKIVNQYIKQHSH